MRRAEDMKELVVEYECGHSERFFYETTPPNTLAWEQEHVDQCPRFQRMQRVAFDRIKKEQHG